MQGFGARPRIGLGFARRLEMQRGDGVEGGEDVVMRSRRIGAV